MDFDSFEDDFLLNIDHEFVGRSKDLQLIQEAWLNHKVFGVFGVRSVGKSRFVKEFLTRQKKLCTFTLKELQIDLNLQTDIPSVHANVCAGLGVMPEIESVENGTWITQIRTEINSLTSQGNVKLVLVFDNGENFFESEVGDKLKSLFVDLIRYARNVKLFITSTTKVLFSQYSKIFYNYELKPLLETESYELLKSVIGSKVKLGEYKDVIIKMSEGLPLLILMIGGELVEDHGMLTPADMAELLSTCRLRTLSREYYPEEDRVADVYKKFIQRLTHFYTRRFAILEFIPGSFNATEAKQMLDYKSVAQVKDQVLIHLRRRFMLTFDPQTHRFNIQGILRECIHTFFALNNITEVRKRYFDTFSRVMQEISKSMGTEDYTKALSEFTLEQPNLQKLLKEVIYTKEDTYHFFIEIATTCTSLIENFMAGNSEKFYDGVLKSADMYGKPKDKSIVHVAMGSLYTNVKIDLPKGAENLRLALEILEQDEHYDLHIATAYQRLGWNLLMQGKSSMAVEYFEKSLAISSRLGKKAELLKLQSLNSLGITTTALGKFEDAERYHFKALEIRKTLQGPNHPSVGATLNNIGIFYNQKGDNENALKYYKEGYEIKKQSPHTPPISLILSLNNMAAEHSGLRQYEEAHELLDEARRLLHKQEVPSQDGIALTHDTRGKVFHSQKKYQEATREFHEAINIRKQTAPDGITHFESLMHAARSFCSMGQYRASLKNAEKALDMKEKANTTMPQNTLVTECLEVVAEVYRLTNNDEQYLSTLGKIESELLRLEKVMLSEMNERKVAKTREQLADVKQKLDRLTWKSRMLESEV